MTSSSSVLVIGDPHFKAANALQTNAFSKEIVEKINDEIDAVVILGDSLHNFDRVDMFPLMRITSFFADIRDKLSGRPLFIIIGNHDRPNNSVFMTNEHAFGALSYWSNTYVIDSAPLSFEIKRSGVKFLFVPYVFPGRFMEAIKGIDLLDGGYACVFAHQEIRGCKLGATVSTKGDVYPPDAPLMISGHIHEFSRPQANVLYPGVPYHGGWVKVDASSSGGGGRGSGGRIEKCCPAIATFSGKELKRFVRINLKTVPINISLYFASPYDFIDAMEEENDGGIAAHYYTNKKFTVDRVKIKVLCKNRNECKELVSKHKLNGVTITPVFSSSLDTTILPTSSSSSPIRNVKFLERIATEMETAAYTEEEAIKFLKKCLPS